MGEMKTINRITEQFIWNGIVKDVKEMVSDRRGIHIFLNLCIQVSSCDVCQRNNRKQMTDVP